MASQWAGIRHQCTSPVLVLLAWGLACALSAGPVYGAGADKEYDALIIQARQGNYGPALVMLRQRVSLNSQDVRAIIDLIVIAGRAGRNEEVIEVYESLGVSVALPAEALATVARAYRDEQQWNQALAIYRKGARPHPEDDTFVLGETMVLADAGEIAEAIRLGRKLVERAPGNADRRLALSYAYARDQQHFAALEQVDKAYQLAPGRAYVKRAYVFALQRADMAEAALRVARASPDLFTPAQMRRLEGDEAAELVRMAGLPARNEHERYVVADRALAILDAQIEAWSQLGPDAQGDVQRARIDRLSALHMRGRMSEVIQEYEQLRADNAQVPRYVNNDVANAYLYMRRPEAAASLFIETVGSPQAADDDPSDRLSNHTGLFYALAEDERSDEAQAVLDEMQGAHEPWVYRKGQPQRLPNDLYVEAMRVGAQGRLLAGDTIDAQARYDELVRQAPNNSGLRAGRAGVLLARQRPREAEQELKMAETQSPRNMAIEVGQGYTALALQEWRQAGLLSQDVLERYPEDLSARQLARAVALHGKAELQVSGSRGIANDSAVAGDGETGIEAVLYSPPVSENWRVFAGAGYASGKFQEGTGHYRWARSGVEWRARDVTIEGEASANNYGFGTKPGLRMAGTVDLNDSWQVGASADWRSRFTPLRALNSGVSSNSLGAFLRWRADERREWALATSAARFSDGNNRFSLGLLGRERLYTAPTLTTDLGMDVSVSRNTSRDTIYFNPRADLTVLPTVQLTHLLYRRYESAWTQTATAGAGLYSQRGYGSGGLLMVSYGQRWQASDALSLGATATATSRPYDGEREREVRIVFDLSLRF
ncbi:poly-beta-1,6 N-acetyl-D-glucosamine export porin PgaA [Bordetella sp. BOR01]|uniref:poly-beta-1,6 N-acetyl-D-glucosamine export porin PgaA n=1 Tax=Bordetella sp. BOR01 TaxID=2854779 RepID=UPI001C479FFF|nr:poly-beta-1,6 N-acetyl-D-glucosamine export porin PgaA [Bordetella sp. BOR01]MBV7486404.1 poly-beta-1,6 N-acetyl-D-glucosamine export porin PgaA [Bordetella sp. BOR01]